MTKQERKRRHGRTDGVTKRCAHLERRIENGATGIRKWCADLDTAA
jgi:hypothetical protein